MDAVVSLAAQTVVAAMMELRVVSLATCKSFAPSHRHRFNENLSSPVWSCCLALDAISEVKENTPSMFTQ